MKTLYYHTLYMIAYAEKNANKMLYYIELSEKIISDKKLDGEINRTQCARLLYYRLTLDYKRGIPLSDFILDKYKRMRKYNEIIQILKIKSELLSEAKLYDEAMNCYQQYYALKDSVSAESQYKALASFSSQHKFNQLKSRNEQLELNTVQNNYQMTGMYYGIALLILLFIMNNYIQLAKQYIQKNHITNDDAILLYADFMYAYLTGDYQKALTLGDKVYAAYKDQKDNTNVVIYILNAKSDIYEQMNQYDKALA